ncbi:GntR family transcriptional regulator [Streptomyces cocklensis]|uniref:GntR family transcriptional regulator n=1 Tax=Actinacidiphila cocklensis TaxID=887465 RepID=UPI00203B97C2|nr:GntR family transcriptional regulator [Actinacidiphila cocklensis]MDD1061641.1 GntR family transcriptional regulator [Actinacidiphila cocklensis]WSX77679.1 GntR family transcriptional regulator [Streptomyces sp. NBC_00899]
MSLHESAVSGSPPEVPYLRIAWELRHDIEQGTFEAGAQLPTQAALVRRFDVSRATVQRALDELRRDGWIDSQQGRGSYVLDRSAAHTAPEPAGVGLTDHIDAAFEADRITLDSFSFTSETLNSALQEPLRRVRRGELRPESIAVRLLLPSPDVRLALPKAVGDADDDRPLRRLRRLTISQAVTVQSAVGALADSGHVADVRVDIRTVPLTPMHKLYLLNGTDALFGYYEVVRRMVPFQQQEMEIYDILGLDATLYHYSADAEDGQGAAFVHSSQRWFETLWSTIAEPLTLFE